MAALDYRVAVTPTSPSGGTAASSVTVQAPACNAGDTLVLAATGATTSSVHPSTPAGWTAQSAGGATLGVYTKTAGSSEGPYTVSFSAACYAVVVVASLAAGTIGTTSFTNSSAGVLTYTPSFPGGVGTDDEVLLFGAVVTPDTFNAGTNLDFPSTWTAEIPPLGPQTPSSGAPATCTVGLASFRGTTSGPALTSATKSQFFTGFLVLTVTQTPPPWLQVTATGAGAPELNATVAGAPRSGMALTVKALTGADTPANIAAHGASAKSTGTATQVTLTAAQSGSLIYGAATSVSTTGIYTAAAGTAFAQNIYNTFAGVNEAYGTFAVTAPTTAGHTVTTGASGPAAPGTQLAAAEILASSILAEAATANAATQYPWDFPGAAAATATFTTLPAVGTLLVAMIAWEQGNTATTVTVSDSAGSAWTEIVSQSGGNQGYAGVWAAQFGVTTGPGTPTGLTVTSTTTDSVSLAWAAPAQGPVSGYDVYMGGAKNTSVTGTTVTVGGLSPTTTYSFTVDAFNSSGTSPQTAAVFATTTGHPPPPQSAGSGCLFGLRPVPTPGTAPETDFAGSVIAREVLIGRKTDIVTTWRNWDPATENTTAELQCLGGGRLPMLTWPLPANVPAGVNAAITAGTYDPIIYGWGQALAALPGQVLFRPMPDANTDPNFGPSPPTAVTSWQRIWTIIKGNAAQFAALSPACTVGPALAAGNVAFVWAMAQRGNAAGGGNLWASYFPGAAYVDWIALDAYNLSPDDQFIDELITTGDYVSTSSSHNWYAIYAGTQDPDGGIIPLMISETGCREPDATQPFTKAAWLAQAATVLPSYPAVRALVYTDAVLPSGDWRMDTTTGGISDSPSNPTLAAFTALATGPYFDRRLRAWQDTSGNLYLLADPPGN